MEKNLRERLEEFIAYKQMSVRKFEKICEFSNGYVRTINPPLFPIGIEKGIPPALALLPLSGS